MGRSPRSRRAVESLARRLARLRVGLAMGTGAALGFSLIGLLKAFEREHIPVDAVAGTSMGSVIGGLFSMGVDPAGLERIVAGIDKAWVWKNLLLDLTVPKSGLFGGITLMRFLKSHFGDREFHDLDLPFACVATDIETGEAVVFKEGSVAKAVRASCGIPLMFQPFEYRGRYLVDGGLVEPTPVRALGELGADILIAANLTMPPVSRKNSLRCVRKGPLDVEPLKQMGVPQMLRAPGMGDVFFQMIYTMEYGITKESAPLAHVYIQPDLSDFSWTELHRGLEIIDAGENGAEAAIGRIKTLLPFFSERCKTQLRSRPWIW
jgi:NTE family protein